MKTILFAGCAAAALLSVTAAAQNAQIAPTPSRPLGLTQDAWNAKLRTRGESPYNPGYVRYVYNPANVFPIRTRESMITTIKLPADEKLTQAFSGDDQGFQIGIPTTNSIAIKALYPGVDTNVVAYTEEGRVYTFYVRSEGYNSKKISDFLIDVVMPGSGITEGGSMSSGENAAADPLAADASYPARAAERIRDPYASLTPDRRSKYREYAEWSDFKPGTVVEDQGVFVPKTESGGTIPYRVFHDDRFTYVDYGPNATQMTEWPTPLIVIQGVEGPVGFRTAGPGGRMMVMEALGSFVLRNGQRMILIKDRREAHMDATLIEYATSGVGPMSNPRDLPPGRPGAYAPAPRTVVPTNGPATLNGEAPSAVVSLPQTRKELKQTRRRAPAPAVLEVQAPSPAEPVRTVVGMAAAATTTVVTDVVKPAMTGSVLKPTTDAAALSGYKVVLAGGDPAQITDRWKSYKVQYYAALNGKRMEVETGADGASVMAIQPVPSIVEGMRICSAINADSENCTVKPAKSAR